jgi:hypothetical protein
MPTQAPPPSAAPFATLDSILMHTTPLYLWGRMVVAPGDTFDRLAQHVLAIPEHLLGSPNTVSDASYIPARRAGTAGQAAMSDTDQLVDIAEQQIVSRVIGAGAGALARAGTGAARAAAFRAAVQEARPMGSPDMAWGARMRPDAIVSGQVPTMTMGQGYQLGNDLGAAGYTLTLGKFPANVQSVETNLGTYTIDRPWGWTPTYNAGGVRGHLDAGGSIRFVAPPGVVDPLTPGVFTGVFRLEVIQIMGRW